MIKSPIKILDYDRNKPEYITNKTKGNNTNSQSMRLDANKSKKILPINDECEVEIERFFDNTKGKKSLINENLKNNWNIKEDKSYFIAVKSINNIDSIKVKKLNDKENKKIANNSNSHENANAIELHKEYLGLDLENIEDCSSLSSNASKSIHKENINKDNKKSRFLGHKKDINKVKEEILFENYQNFKKNINDIQTVAYNDILLINSIEVSKRKEMKSSLPNINNHLKFKSRSNSLIENKNKIFEENGTETINKVKKFIVFKEMQMKPYSYKEKIYKSFFDRLNMMNLYLLKMNKYQNHNNLRNMNRSSNNNMTNKIAVNNTKSGKEENCLSSKREDIPYVAKIRKNKASNKSFNFNDVIHVLESIKKSQFNNLKKTNLSTNKNENSLDNTPRLLYLAKDHVLEKCNVINKKYNS